MVEAVEAMVDVITLLVGKAPEGEGGVLILPLGQDPRLKRYTKQQSLLYSRCPRAKTVLKDNTVQILYYCFFVCIACYVYLGIFIGMGMDRYGSHN